jgi:hypothetical protein
VGRFGDPRSQTIGFLVEAVAPLNQHQGNIREIAKVFHKAWLGELHKLGIFFSHLFFDKFQYPNDIVFA